MSLTWIDKKISNLSFAIHHVNLKLKVHFCWSFFALWQCYIWTCFKEIQSETEGLMGKMEGRRPGIATCVKHARVLGRQKWRKNFDDPTLEDDKKWHFFLLQNLVTFWSQIFFHENGLQKFFQYFYTKMVTQNFFNLFALKNALKSDPIFFFNLFALKSDPTFFSIFLH